MVSLLHNCVANSADKYPDAEAFCFPGQRLTYAELAKRSDEVASALIESGVKKGDRVGLYLNKSLETAISLYGAMKAGVAYVPLDPGAPPERTHLVMEQCDVRALITHKPKASDAIKVLQGYSLGKLACVIGLEEALAGVELVSWSNLATAGPLRAPTIDEHDLAYIIFTSGSTGAPKGIMHTHESGLCYAKAAAGVYGVSYGDRLSNHSPLHFDMSTFDYFCAPLTGASTVIIPEPYAKLPASLSKLIQDEQLTHWYSAPFALIQLLQNGALSKRDLTSLRWVMFGGEPFPAKYLAALMALLPGARFSNVYGPAEVNHCTHHHVKTAELETGQPPPIGRVWENAEGLILNEHDQLTKPGDIGELVINSKTMMQGYWGRPDLNANAFYQGLSSQGVDGRFYRTGDLVKDEGDGVMRFLGRKDRQVKVRGFRIELDEVEAALVAHGAVDEAAAILLEEDGDIKAIVGVVTIQNADRKRSIEEEILNFVASKLPAYAVPVRVDTCERFPRTTSGKIDRRALKASLRQFRDTAERAYAG